ELGRWRRRMNVGELAHDARYFRAIAGDEETSVVDDRGRSQIVREGNSELNIPAIAVSIHGERYQLNAQSFFQTNVDLLPQLIDSALGNARGEDSIELCSVA